ncbi:MAG: hypothetical protein KC516_04715 [Nanoarchaeota archaeon]|nr:hypothetical protein [Nanoarchaeota archaeon]
MKMSYSSNKIILSLFFGIFLIGIVSAGNIIVKEGKIIADDSINASLFIGDGSLLTNLNLTGYNLSQGNLSGNGQINFVPLWTGDSFLSYDSDFEFSPTSNILSIGSSNSSAFFRVTSNQVGGTLQTLNYVSDNSATPAVLNFKKEKAGGDHILNGDYLGMFAFDAEAGTFLGAPQTARVAGIYSVIDQAPANLTDNWYQQSGALIFAAGTAISTSLPTERMRISSNGYVGIGNSNPQYKLDVVGNASFSGFVNAGSYKVGGSSGASGHFSSNDGKTVEVTNGIITSIS